MSGTVLPKTVWNRIRSSSGAAGNPQDRANSSDEVSACRAG
jgi:hypothetical protein